MALSRSKREEQVKKHRRVSFSGLVKNGATIYSSDEESRETIFIEEKEQTGKQELNGSDKLSAVSGRGIGSDAEDADMEDEDSEETDDAEETEQMEEARQKEKALMRKLSQTITVEIVDNEDEIRKAKELGAYKSAPVLKPKEDSQPLTLNIASIFNPLHVSRPTKDLSKIKIKEEPTEITAETEVPLLPVRLIKCGVESDSEATLSADESRMYMVDSDPGHSDPMSEHNYSTPYFFRRRTAMEEMLILYDFIESGLDKEDRMYLRRSYEALLHDRNQRFWLKGTRWTFHPLSKKPFPKKEHPSLRTHLTGCARCEGYYKLNVQEKAYSNQDSLLMSWSYL